METGYSLSFHCPCVYLSLSDTDTEKEQSELNEKAKRIIEYAVGIGATDRDGEELIIVRFPGESSDEAVTEEELKARLSVPLVNG